MLSVLEAAPKNDSRDFTTRDESWFFLQQAARWMWGRERAHILQKPCLTIKVRKLMSTIFWRTLGFHLADSLPAGTGMSSTCFTHTILRKTTAAFFAEEKRDRSPTGTLHLENCSVYTSGMAENLMEQNGRESMACSPSRLDLGPGDFFMFQLVRRRPDQVEWDDSDDLLEAIIEIWGGLQADDLYPVFQEWADQVRVRAEGDGGSIPGETIHSYIAAGYLGSVGVGQGLIPRVMFKEVGSAIRVAELHFPSSSTVCQSQS
jgi:hypothetical protein